MGCGIYSKEDICSKMLEIKLEREQIRKDRELAFKEYEILYGEDLYYSRKPVEDYISYKSESVKKKKKKKKKKTIVYSYSESKSNETPSLNEEEEKADDNLRTFIRNKTLKNTLKEEQENNESLKNIINTNNTNNTNNGGDNNEKNNDEKVNFTALRDNFIKLTSKKNEE